MTSYQTSEDASRREELRTEGSLFGLSLPIAMNDIIGDGSIFSDLIFPPRKPCFRHF